MDYEWKEINPYKKSPEVNSALFFSASQYPAPNLRLSLSWGCSILPSTQKASSPPSRTTVSSAAIRSWACPCDQMPAYSLACLAALPHAPSCSDLHHTGRPYSEQDSGAHHPHHAYPGCSLAHRAQLVREPGDNGVSGRHHAQGGQPVPPRSHGQGQCTSVDGPHRQEDLPGLLPRAPGPGTQASLPFNQSINSPCQHWGSVCKVTSCTSDMEQPAVERKKRAENDTWAWQEGTATSH